MKKQSIVITGFMALVLGWLIVIQPLAEGRERPTVIRSYFSPKGGVMKAVIEEIRGADKSVDAALYMLTAPKLAHELVAARKRGVRVRVILDKRMSGKWSKVDTLEEGGVDAWLIHLPKGRYDKSNPQFHHKFAVIDSERVVTGSYNWTVTADERNHENLLIIHDRSLASKYAEVFEKAMRLAQEGD